MNWRKIIINHGTKWILSEAEGIIINPHIKWISNIKKNKGNAAVVEYLSSGLDDIEELKKVLAVNFKMIIRRRSPELIKLIYKEKEYREGLPLKPD